jgi:hypothetical protein
MTYMDGLLKLYFPDSTLNILYLNIDSAEEQQDYYCRMLHDGGFDLNLPPTYDVVNAENMTMFALFEPKNQFPGP